MTNAAANRIVLAVWNCSRQPDAQYTEACGQLGVSPDTVAELRREMRRVEGLLPPHVILTPSNGKRR